MFPFLSLASPIVFHTGDLLDLGSDRIKSPDFSLCCTSDLERSLGGVAVIRKYSIISSLNCLKGLFRASVKQTAQHVMNSLESQHTDLIWFSQVPVFIVASWIDQRPKLTECHCCSYFYSTYWALVRSSFSLRLFILLSLSKERLRPFNRKMLHQQ